MLQHHLAQTLKSRFGWETQHQQISVAKRVDVLVQWASFSMSKLTYTRHGPSLCLAGGALGVLGGRRGTYGTWLALVTHLGLVDDGRLCVGRSGIPNSHMRRISPTQSPSPLLLTFPIWTSPFLLQPFGRSWHVGLSGPLISSKDEASAHLTYASRGFECIPFANLGVEDEDKGLYMLIWHISLRFDTYREVTPWLQLSHALGALRPDTIGFCKALRPRRSREAPWGCRILADDKKRGPSRPTDVWSYMHQSVNKTSSRNSCW